MSHIIAFAGRKQSGKTTCAEFVKSYAENRLKSQIYNFADLLKQNVCMSILGLTYEQCYGTDIEKNQLVDCYWDGKQLSAREVMQFVGTDIFRKLQTNVWASATISRIKNDNIDLAIIADCRFPNEVEAIKNSGGVVIKLNRNPHRSTHESEMALDEDRYSQKNFDLILNNQNMTINEQNIIIGQFLTQINL
jgi:hypothetical protein